MIAYGLEILSVHVSPVTDDAYGRTGRYCHLVLSSCPSHVGSDFMAGHYFDKEGFYSVEVGPSEKTGDWINIVTLLLMSLGGRWNPFEDASCKQLLRRVWRRFLKLTLICFTPQIYHLLKHLWCPTTSYYGIQDEMPALVLFMWSCYLVWSPSCRI